MIKYIREHKEFVMLAFLQLSTIVIDHSYFGSDAVFSPIDFYKAVAKLIVLFLIVVFSYRQATSQEKKEAEQDNKIETMQEKMITATPIDETMYKEFFEDSKAPDQNNIIYFLENKKQR